MIKVIISPSYSTIPDFPIAILDFGKEILKKDSILWRFNEELIKKIEEQNYEIATKLNAAIPDLTKSYKVKVENGYRYVFPNPSNSLSKFGILEIVEVDETKRWRIDEYDNYESVQYIDDYELISEKYNYYK